MRMAEFGGIGSRPRRAGSLESTAAVKRQCDGTGRDSKAYSTQRGPQVKTWGLNVGQA